MANKYIHVRCEEYSLLIDIRWVKEVINTVESANNQEMTQWRDKKIHFLDLTQILMGHKLQNNRHCIILTAKEGGSDFRALGVGHVLNIQSIKDEEFLELPSLDFAFNDYFDKVFISKKDKKCIYRLKNLAMLQQG